MNASTFFTKQAFECLKADIGKEKIITYIDNPYEHTHKANGNKYKLAIHTGRYTFEEKYGQYYVSLWVDYNYKGIYDSRNQGGYSMHPSFDSYEAFKESINQSLRQYPDYIEEEQPIQMSLFDLIPQI